MHHESPNIEAQMQRLVANVTRHVPAALETEKALVDKVRGEMI